MRILFSLYLLLIINIALSQNCEILAKNGMYLLELKQIGSDSIMSVNSIILHSTGAIEYVDKTIKFLTNSTLAFEGLEYPVVECKDDILTIKLNSLFNPNGLHQYKINKVNKIIDDPVNQIDTLNSMCNQLSLPGVYNLEIEDDDENIFNATINIISIKKIIFHYLTISNEVEYKEGISEIGEGNIQKIDSCKDYLSNSKLRLGGLNPPSFIIKKIVPSQPSDKAIRNGYCQLLSVKGSYILWDGNHQIGKLDVKEDSVYKYTNYLTDNDFFLEYNIESYPVLTEEKSIENEVVLCKFYKGTYTIKLNGGHVYYNFTNVTVLHQDSSYLLAIKQKRLEELDQKYNLSEQIKSSEIEHVMHSLLQIPYYKDDEHDFCMKLIMPGTYVITDKNGKKHEFINTNVLYMKALFNDHSLFKTIFAFKVKEILPNKEVIDHNYKCEVYKNESELIYGIEKSTPLTTTSQESLVHIKIASIDSFTQTLNKNWTNNPKYKIIFRSKKSCSELEPNSNYKFHTFDGSLAEVFIKRISSRDFDFTQGFRVYLFNKKVKDSKEYSNIRITDRDKKKTDNNLLYCFSNENGSYFYDTNYKDILEHRKYVHHSLKHKSEYKFIKLEKIKSLI